ncbi:hypothetical protein DH2020_006710 [Rehmannia glutinosa]|uniref:Uncharacterized protein n=1 Tax=Rehmannia glutinosa TaxID=99300 RepID=A0ABR0XJS2_REHGL
MQRKGEVLIPGHSPKNELKELRMEGAENPKNRRQAHNFYKLDPKMARWDEILSLPVQNPPTLEFGSTDLVWSKVEGYRDNLDRLALIPFARVDDFVRGESNNKECPTRYWCSFGPDDHRKGGIVRPSRTTYVPKNKSAGRPNTKRGCTCHFIVKRLTAEPSVALIIYNQDKHVDKKGLPCHGPQDKKAAGTRAMYAPYISEELRLRVLSLLHVGVSVETIMQRHNESVEKQGGPCNRDDLLTHRYVRRQERSIRRSTYELDEDDAVSISMWVESHQNNVFFYEDFSDSDPFTLGIQTEWQLQQMIQFGNCRLLAYDSNLYPVHSLVVFNSDNKAIPVAWIITPRFASRDTHRWIRALYNRVRAKDPTWKLAGFILDDPSADIRAIREVFQCSVLICFWRVRHAWHKNLMKRCSNMEMRAEIAKQLGEAVKVICKGPGTADAFEDFMENSVDAAEFVDYFKAIWYPRIGMWARALKTLPLASQETCAAMEFYHAQLKIRLLNEKDQSGKRILRYWKDEWMSGPTAWRKSLKIPDAHVVMEGEYAKVIGPKDQGTAHLVLNPGSSIQSVIVVGQKWELIQALINMLHCPPFDSLVRDHAVSLAVWVQLQLNAQICPENRSAEDQTAEPFMGSPDKVVDNTNHCPGKAMSPQLEIPGDDMEVDSSSICTSAPQLFSTDGNTSIGVYVENGTDLMDASTDVEFKNTDGFKNLEKGQCLTLVEVEPQLIASHTNTLQTGAYESEAAVNSSSSIAVTVDVKIDSPTFDAIIVNGPALSDRMLKADSERSFLLNGTSPLVVECIAAGKYNVPLSCGALMLLIMTTLTTLGSIKLPNEGDLIRGKINQQFAEFTMLSAVNTMVDLVSDEGSPMVYGENASLM